MVTMVKDRFGCRHTPVRDAGYIVRKRIMDGVTFSLRYLRSEVAGCFIEVSFGGYYFSISCLRLSFCRACGAFLGFGILYEICWICRDDYESEDFLLPELEV